MATIIEKKFLEVLQNINYACEHLTVNSDNTDVVSAITNLEFDSSDIVQAVENIDFDSSEIVSAIQNLTYPTILAKQDLALTKLDTAISRLETISTSITSLIAAVNAKSPIIKAATATFREILSANIPAATPVRLMAANANRIGYVITNNSTNSLYVGPTNPPSGAKQFFQLASNAGPTCMIQCFGPMVWTGELWCYRNSGTGGVTGYEFEA